MDIDRRMKRALHAVESALSALKRAQRDDDGKSDIDRAIRQLKNAESDIRIAIKELPDS